MKSKSLILMVVSLGFGLIAAIGISKVMGRSNGTKENTMKMGPVLVSTAVLKHGEPLNEENLKIENWPLQIIPEDAVTSFEDVENMAITTPLSKNLAIMKSNIVNVKDITRVNIPPGFKVIAIKVPASGTVGGLLEPGDKIDVIGVVKVRDSENSREIRTVSKTFLKFVTVFAVNDKMKVGGERKADGGKNKNIVSVLLNERQTEMLVLIQSVAQLQIVMCGDGDGEDNEDFDSEATLSVFGLGTESKGETHNVAINDVKADRFKMRIWGTGEYQTYNFVGGVPEQGPGNTDAMADQAKSNDSEDYTNPNDFRNGLEEDNYLGE